MLLCKNLGLKRGASRYGQPFGRKRPTFPVIGIEAIYGNTSEANRGSAFRPEASLEQVSSKERSSKLALGTQVAVVVAFLAAIATFIWAITSGTEASLGKLAPVPADQDSICD